MLSIASRHFARRSLNRINPSISTVARITSSYNSTLLPAAIGNGYHYGTIGGTTTQLQYRQFASAAAKESKDASTSTTSDTGEFKRKKSASFDRSKSDGTSSVKEQQTFLIYLGFALVSLNIR